MQRRRHERLSTELTDDVGTLMGHCPRVQGQGPSDGDQIVDGRPKSTCACGYSWLRTNGASRRNSGGTICASRNARHWQSHEQAGWDRVWGAQFKAEMAAEAGLRAAHLQVAAGQVSCACPGVASWMDGLPLVQLEPVQP